MRALHSEDIAIASEWLDMKSRPDPLLFECRDRAHLTLQRKPSQFRQA